MTFKITEDLLKLTEIVREFEAGSRYSYEQLQQLTGIEMDIRGKDILRRAFKRAKIERFCIKGFGIEVVSEDTAVASVSSKLLKVDSAVKRGEVAHTNIQSKFFGKLNKGDQERILFIGAIFGAIRASASKMRGIYKERKPINATIARIEAPK